MRTTDLRRAFGAIGTVVGVIVASGFMPVSCGMNETQSGRLRVGLPLLFLGVLVVLAQFFDWRLRRKLPLSKSSIWRWVPVALLAPVVLAVGASAIYGEMGFTDLLSHAVVAFVVLGPALAAVLLATLWSAWSARSAQVMRRGSPPATAYSVMHWPVLAGCAGIVAGVYWGLPQKALDLRLAYGGLVAGALLLAAGWHALARLREAERMLLDMPLPPATAYAAPDADLDGAFDAGVGTTVVAADHDRHGPFRDGRHVWLGDHAPTRLRLRHSRIAATVILVLGVAGWMAGLLGVVRSPPWKEPSSLSFGLGRC